MLKITAAQSILLISLKVDSLMASMIRYGEKEEKVFFENSQGLAIMGYCKCLGDVPFFKLLAYAAAPFI